MANLWLKARQTRYAAYAAVYSLVVLAAAVTANLLSVRYYKTLDTTANQRNSLSEQSVKLVNGMSQSANIAYFNQSSAFGEGKDLLDEYAGLSPKIHVEYVDPDKSPERARLDGVHEPGTVVVQVGNRKEIADTTSEEGITGALIRILKGNTRLLCFVSGSGERRIDDGEREGLSSYNEMLAGEQFQTKTVDLLQKAEVPSECTVLIAAGPRFDYLKPEVDAIRKYVEGGGRALFLLDAPLVAATSSIAVNETLATMLQGWGVTLDKDMVLDFSSAGQLAGLGSQVSLVSDYNTAQPIVSEMKGLSVGLPLARSMEIKATGKTTIQKLFASSDSSLGALNPKASAVDVADPKNKKGPLMLGAAGTYDTGKPSPSGKTLKGRFVVIGSSGWLANGFLGFNGNGDLAINVVSWLASDEDMIAIRPRPKDERTIALNGGQMNRLRITSQFGLPLGVVLAGFAVWWRRRW